MSDIFREVDEDLRRDRMERLFKRHGGAILAAALLIVAAAGGFAAWKAWTRSSREEATAALSGALARATEAPADAVKALSSFAGTAGSGEATLARLNAAALLVRDGKGTDAVSVYETVAADRSAETVYRDYAALMVVLHQAASGDPAALRARLAPLLVDTSPWRFSARELDGLLAARAGDVERARTAFRQLADDPQTPAGVRARAADLATLYGKS